MGILIVVEGISGSGKSSLVKELCNEFEKYGISHASYGGFNISDRSTVLTKFCNYIVKRKRFIGLPIISETHLLLSEMIMDIDLNVKKDLRNNKVIVYENYFDSVHIYQSARIQTMSISQKEKNNLQHYLDETIELVEQNIDIPKPDIIVYLDQSIDICNKRILNRDNLEVTCEHARLQSEIKKRYLEYYLEKTNVIFFDNESLQKELLINSLVLYVQKRKENLTNDYSC